MDRDAFAQSLQDLRADRTHGAAELAGRAMDVLEESARGAAVTDGAALKRELDWRAGALAEARPGMMPLANLTRRFRADLDALDPADPGSLRRDAAAAARRLRDVARTAAEQAADNAAAAISAGSTLLLHSESSTVRRVLHRLVGHDVRAIVTESRPRDEGRSVAARLAAWGFAVDLVPDAAVGLMADRADLALVGADTLLPDGGVVNKAGTFPLALACRAAGVPFCVVSKSFKQRPGDMPPPDNEADDPGLLHPPAGVTGVNWLFDTTPARLVAWWYDEHGAHRGPAAP